MHLGIPNWQYAFTKAGLDSQTLQWFRFFIPERLAIDIENRKFLEMMAKKKQGHIKPNSQYKFANDKIKIEGLKRKRRRMRLKAKQGNEAIIEKFSAQSCKTAKYAKTIVKKREPSELKPTSANQDSITAGDGRGGANDSASASGIANTTAATNAGVEKSGTAQSIVN